MCFCNVIKTFSLHITFHLFPSLPAGPVCPVWPSAPGELKSSNSPHPPAYPRSPRPSNSSGPRHEGCLVWHSGRDGAGSVKGGRRGSVTYSRYVLRGQRPVRPPTPSPKASTAARAHRSARQKPNAPNCMRLPIPEVPAICECCQPARAARHLPPGGFSSPWESPFKQRCTATKQKCFVVFVPFWVLTFNQGSSAAV